VAEEEERGGRVVFLSLSSRGFQWASPLLPHCQQHREEEETEEEAEEEEEEERGGEVA